MDSLSTRLYVFFKRQRIKVLFTTLFILLTLIGLHYVTPTRQPESSRLQFPKHIDRRSRSPMATPGVIVGLVLGCLFGLLVVLLAIFFTTRRKRGAQSAGSIRTTSRVSTRDSHLEWEIETTAGSSMTPDPEFRVELAATHHLNTSLRAIFLSDDTDESFSHSPRDIWKPTESELDMVQAQWNNPSFYFPLSLDLPVQLENERLSQNGTFKIAEENMTEENLFYSVQNDRIDGYSAPGAPDIANETFVGSAQCSDPESFPDLDIPQPASPKMPSELSQAKGQIEQKILPCPAPHCTRIFTKQYKLNHHLRYHQRPKQCPTCGKSFGIATHLERHINSAHSSSRRWHCPVSGCKHSKSVGNGGFTRKDNWRRHMKDKHDLT